MDKIFKNDLDRAVYLFKKHLAHRRFWARLVKGNSYTFFYRALDAWARGVDALACEDYPIAFELAEDLAAFCYAIARRVKAIDWDIAPTVFLYLVAFRSNRSQELTDLDRRFLSITRSFLARKYN